MTEVTNEVIISCKNVHKWFGDFQALRGIDMEVHRGEVIVIFGPSGSGKSTFIRTLNRLEEHQKGDIIVDGIELSHDIRGNVGRDRVDVFHGRGFRLFDPGLGFGASGGEFLLQFRPLRIGFGFQLGSGFVDDGVSLLLGFGERLLIGGNGFLGSSRQSVINFGERDLTGGYYHFQRFIDRYVGANNLTFPDYL